MAPRASRSTEGIWSQQRRSAAPPSPQWARYTETRSIRLRNAIVLANGNLALEIAHRWKNSCDIPFEDLSQIAQIGLVKAVEKFDPSKGNAFSSFAVPYIDGEVRHFLRDHAWDMVKVPRRQIESAAKVRKLQRSLASLGRLDVDETKIAGAIGIPAHKWQQTAEATSRKTVVELDEVLHGSVDASDEAAAKEREWATVRSAVAKLPNPYRHALTEKFFSQMSDESIARSQNVDVAQVQVWIEEGLKRLRNGQLGRSREIG